MQQKPYTSAQSLEQVRKAILLEGIDVRTQRGVEFGPLDCPLVAKTDGRVLYIDYADAEELRAKHGHRPGKDPADIVEVDRIWSDALPRVLRDDLPLDYAVACHVIEHVPDLVGWLGEVARVLRPGGRLCLAVPDKRYTFDRLRAPSDLSAAMSAHVEELRRPSPWQVFDHHSKAVSLPLREAWQGRIDPAGLARIHDFGHALRQTRKAREGEYVDCHCWVFTPFSFLNLMAELTSHGLAAFRLASFHETRPNTFEFHACLTCDPAIMEDAGLRSEAEASFRDRLPWYGASAPGEPTTRDLLEIMQAMGRRLEAGEGRAAALQASLEQTSARLREMRDSLALADERLLEVREAVGGPGAGGLAPRLRRLAGRMADRVGLGRKTSVN